MYLEGRVNVGSNPLMGVCDAVIQDMCNCEWSLAGVAERRFSVKDKVKMSEASVSYVDSGKNSFLLSRCVVRVVSICQMWFNGSEKISMRIGVPFVL